MTEEQLVKDIQGAIDRDMAPEIAPAACIRYLRFLANDYGKEGKMAKKLLDLVGELLEVA